MLKPKKSYQIDYLRFFVAETFILFTLYIFWICKKMLDMITYL